MLRQGSSRASLIPLQLCFFFHKETSFAVLPSLKCCTRLMYLTTLNEIISALILKSSGNELYSLQINNHHIRKKTIFLQYCSSFSACVTVSLLLLLAWNNSAFKTPLLCLVIWLEWCRGFYLKFEIILFEILDTISATFQGLKWGVFLLCSILIFLTVSCLGSV